MKFCSVFLLTIEEKKITAGRALQEGKERRISI